MKKNNESPFTVKCPLCNSIIDSDLCIEVQDCIEGNIPVSIEYEDFLEAENHAEVCSECKYHI